MSIIPAVAKPKCFDSMMAHYGKFSGVENYIALVGKKDAGLVFKGNGSSSAGTHCDEPAEVLLNTGKWGDICQSWKRILYEDSNFEIGGWTDSQWKII